MRKFSRWLLCAALACGFLIVGACGGGSSRDTGSTGPTVVERRRSPFDRIPNYRMPLPGTYSLTRKINYPRTTRWNIPESQLRQGLAIQPGNRLPNISLRVTEMVNEGIDPMAALEEMELGLDDGADMEEAPPVIMPADDDDPMASEYHQTLEINRQLIPSEYSKNDLTLLTMNLTKPAKLLKFEVRGQDLAFSVHREGFPGALIERDNANEFSKVETIGNPEFGTVAETGAYSLKVRLLKNLDTRVYIKVSYWPVELPPQPTPTPIPEIPVDEEFTSDDMEEMDLGEDEGMEEDSMDDEEMDEDISYEEEE